MTEITITGMFADWTQHLEDLGYRAETKDTVREITKLPENAVRLFGLPADRVCFKRERMSYANGTPICAWSTYYPIDLLDNILGQLIQGAPISVMDHVYDMHHLTLTVVDERYASRITTFDELNRFQLTEEQSILILERAGFTHNSDLILYSEMSLLGNWFDVRRTYTVDHWKK
jgi:DNA-binding GntR family transcriptional regulator